ncbi:SRPBCC family protein [Microcella sp.]|uniref:SRPBCC family protein n=1 Tax=Microcella sp. TaxID=1913979 RepID=UPI002566B594|nr:SRPBCC family protein [Microcella sp.]MBX9471357.1 SRPBCC family protein [Microcella sp.]
MARTTRLLQCPPEAVFAVLADGWTYPSWVVGASRMRAVDENWPEPGARIFHSVGVWPALIDDETEVTEWNAPHRAAFIARGWPIGEARIIIEVRPHRQGCVVRMHEYAVRGALQYVPRVLTDPLLDFRNREALHRLGYLAEGQWVNDETEERSTPEERGDA